MKIRIAIIGAALLAAGCHPKPDPNVAKLAALESRLGELESRFDQLHRGHTNLAAAVTALGDVQVRGMANLTSVFEEGRGRLETSLADISQTMETILASTSNRPPSRIILSHQQPVARSAPPASREGVPTAIYNQIAADAARKWPGEFDMQAWTIKRQIEAYRLLHP